MEVVEITTKLCEVMCKMVGYKWTGDTINLPVLLMAHKQKYGDCVENRS